MPSLELAYKPGCVCSAQRHSTGARCSKLPRKLNREPRHSIPPSIMQAQLAPGAQPADRQLLGKAADVGVGQRTGQGHAHGLLQRWLQCTHGWLQPLHSTCCLSSAAPVRCGTHSDMQPEMQPQALTRHRSGPCAWTAPALAPVHSWTAAASAQHVQHQQQLPPGTQADMHPQAVAAS